MTFPLSPLPINRCLLFAKNTMKYNPFEFKLCLNPLCMSCPSDSLRERARSERLRNLGERLRWVRGPGVRHSQIHPYLSISFPYPPPFLLLRPISHSQPLPSPPLQLNPSYFTPFPVQGRSTKLAIFIPEDVKSTSVHGSFVPLLLYHS